MDKTLYSEEYAIFLKLLKEERSSKSIFQAELADRLGEHQSFVSKVEGNVRRLDIIEAMSWCRALGVDWRTFQEKLLVALDAHSMAATGGATSREPAVNAMDAENKRRHL